MAEAKQYKTSILKPDLEEFQASIKEGTTDKYVQNYISNHTEEGVTSKEDVYSLMLIAAVSLEVIPVIEHILSQKHNDNILTSIDDRGYSPITRIMYSGNQDILSLVEEYINRDKTIIPKTTILEPEFLHIKEILKFPQFEEMDVDSCVEQYLQHLYGAVDLDKVMQGFDAY